MLFLSGCSFSYNENEKAPIFDFRCSFVEKYGNTSANINNLGLVAFDESNVYYTKWNGKNQKLFKLQDGNEKEICDLNYTCLNVVDKEYYYVDSNTDYIMHMNSVTYKKDIIVDLKVRALNVYDKKLYFICTAEENNNCLFSANIDGSNLTQLTHERIYDFCIYKGKVFYTAINPETDTCSLYSLNSEGKCNLEFNAPSHIGWFCIFDNGFAVYMKNSIYKVVDGKTEILVSNLQVPDNTVNISGNSLVFRTVKDSKLHLIDLKTNSYTSVDAEFPQGNTGCLYVVNNGVFWYGETSDLYKINEKGIAEKF